MQQRVTPKSLIAENKRRDYCRVRNHLKVILSDRSIGLFQSVSQTTLEFVLKYLKIHINQNPNVT